MNVTVIQWLSMSIMRLHVLHYAVIYNNSDAAEYLLSTGKCNPLARDKDGYTPMKLAVNTNFVPIFKKFGKIKSSHPIDSYVNVLLLGNLGAGKSTLSHVITDTATGFVAFDTFRNVKGVEPYVLLVSFLLNYNTRHWVTSFFTILLVIQNTTPVTVLSLRICYKVLVVCS